MKTINKKYYYIGGALLILAAFLFIPKRCTWGDKETVTTEIKIDTLWKTHTDTIIKTVTQTSYKIVPAIGPEFTPSNNIDSCNYKFEKLKDKYFAERVYADTIKITGTKGTLVAIDTIWQNKFKGKRKYINTISIPEITKTITETKQAEPRRQLYFGGNLFGDQNHIQTVAPGLLYKDKKDFILQANIGVNLQGGGVIYGIGAYSKFDFNKKK